jgi:hypothetical protein
VPEVVGQPDRRHPTAAQLAHECVAIAQRVAE